MSLTNQISTYPDCFDLFQRAADSPAGVRAPTANYETAKLLQMRMHQARALQRQEARRIYPLDDIRWGKSVYDHLVVRVRQDTEGTWWVYVEGQNMYIMTEVEELEEPPQLTQGKTPQLTYNPIGEDS